METPHEAAHCGAMPRYFFHLRDDHSRIDDLGLELPDATAAIDEAVRRVRRFASGQVEKGQLRLWHRYDVSDEHGLVVASIQVRDAVAIDDAEDG